MRKTSLDGVHALARADPRVLFVGSDLGPDTLSGMREELPDQFFMEGVSEANVIGMAAGLAMEGFIPYVNTIATFITRRCYEQVALDLCLHDLPVRLIGNGGGLVYAPLGPTHLATEDIAIMRSLPNMTVVAVADADEMRRFMRSSLDWPHPIYIRLGKGGDPLVTAGIEDFTIGRAYPLRPAGEACFVSCGIVSGLALQAAEILAGEGIDCGVLHVPTVKPLDDDAILRVACETDLLVTAEEHVLAGGLGGAVAELLADRGVLPGRRLLRLGIPDRFVDEYGSQDTLLEKFGLRPAQMAASVKAALTGGGR